MDDQVQGQEEEFAGEPEPTPSPGEMSKDERTWGMLCHLSALAGVLIPFGNVIGPLVVWLMKREEYAFVEQEGKKALNFQISLVIYGIVAAFLCFILIGLLLLPLLLVFGLVMVIMASIRANEGKSFDYPLSIQFFK